MGNWFRHDQSDRMTILIVDDNPNVRRLIRVVISAPGAHIVECVNGVEAVSAYDACRPDVVLMDLDMPELDGLVATRQIRAVDPDAQVIVVTNHEMSTCGKRRS